MRRSTGGVRAAAARCHVHPQGRPPTPPLRPAPTHHTISRQSCRPSPRSVSRPQGSPEGRTPHAGSAPKRRRAGLGGARRCRAALRTDPDCRPNHPIRAPRAVDGADRRLGAPSLLRHLHTEVDVLVHRFAELATSGIPIASSALRLSREQSVQALVLRHGRAVQRLVMILIESRAVRMSTSSRSTRLILTRAHRRSDRHSGQSVGRQQRPGPPTGRTVIPVVAMDLGSARGRGKMAGVLASTPSAPWCREPVL